MDLQNVDVDAIFRILAEGDVDHHNCWLGRAYHSFGGRPVSQAFRAAVAAEIGKAREALKSFDDAGDLVLYRGLLCEPDLSSVGRHWSNDKAVANEYGPYLVTANVSTDAVDWCGTVLRRIGWPHEREITLARDAHVLVLAVEHSGRVLATDVEAPVSKVDANFEPTVAVRLGL
jgi:hypothetical protein